MRILLFDVTNYVFDLFHELYESSLETNYKFHSFLEENVT